MTFTSMKEVRDAIRKHAIVERRDLRWVKNDPTRVRLTCKWKGCGWLFFASMNNRFKVFQLKNYKEHVCPEHYKNMFVTPTAIATHYKDMIKSNPRWKNRHMRQTVREDFGFEVTVMQCSRAKAKVLRTTFESYKTKYALLRNYAEELLRVNPGSSFKGLVPSIVDLFPDAEHRLCARHIYNNWRKNYTNPEWQKIFWRCAKSSTEALFNRSVEEMRQQNAAAVDAMKRIDPRHWSRAFFKCHAKCDSVDNNMSESFNSLIVEARHKPIFSMLEDIRMMCMEQIAVKRKLASNWKADTCPKILRKLSERARAVRYCHIIGSGKDGYEVRYKDGDRFTVRLDEKKCSCRSWDLTGIPCPHAITCIISEGNDPEKYISKWYTVQKYWATYDNVMTPLDGHELWPPSQYAPVLPPHIRKMPGRPRKNRVRAVEERQDGVRRRKRSYTNKHLLKRDGTNPTKMSRGNNGASSSRQPFAGVGVYTNVDTGQTVLNPSSTSEVVLNEGSSQGVFDHSM
ncbi:hypothetical protein LINPERPRIM_LOCUS33109 [Linum perenne]